jgi:hypothetical protein
VTGWVKAISPISVAVPSPSGSSGGRWRDCRTYRGVGCGTVRSGTSSIFRVENLISVRTEHFGGNSECEETAGLLQICISLA